MNFYYPLFLFALLKFPSQTNASTLEVQDLLHVLSDESFVNYEDFDNASVDKFYKSISELASVLPICSSSERALLELGYTFSKKIDSDKRGEQYKLAVSFIYLYFFVEQIQPLVVTKVWEQLNIQFRSQGIWKQMSSEDRIKKMNQVKQQIKKSLDNTLSEKVYRQGFKDLEHLLRGDITNLAREVFQLKVYKPVLSTVCKVLSRIDFAEAYEKGGLEYVVDFSSRISSLVFQLGMFPILNSESLEYLVNRTENQIELSSFDLKVIESSLKSTLQLLPESITKTLISQVLAL